MILPGSAMAVGLATTALAAEAVTKINDNTTVVVALVGLAGTALTVLGTVYGPNLKDRGHRRAGSTSLMPGSQASMRRLLNNSRQAQEALERALEVEKEINAELRRENAALKRRHSTAAKPATKRTDR